MRPTKFTFAAADRDGICLSQTTAGSGSLVINGDLVDKPSTMQGVTRAVVPGGAQRTMTLFSLGNISGVLFTFTGKNLKKETVTEALLGPTANATVQTVNQYSQIDSIAVNAAVATAVEVGTGPVGVTNWMVLDQNQNPSDATLYLAMASAISVTLQATPDDVQVESNPDIFVVDDFDGVSASQGGKLGQMASAVRAAVISSSGDGAMEFTVLQAGI